MLLLLRKEYFLVILSTLIMSISSLSSIDTYKNNLKNTKVLSAYDFTTKSNKDQIIGTHDGSFHCDEALACAMLKLLPIYSNSDDTTIIRTRKPDILNQCDIVVDVGAEYDNESKRYDHHQRSFTDTLDNYATKLSSAGLVYKHYGKDIIKSILKNIAGANDNEIDENLLNIFYHKLYINFVEHIDANDNGVAISDDDTTLKYIVSSALPQRVGRLNPAWNEETYSNIYNERFIEAMCLTGGEFIEQVLGLYQSWLPARSIVEDSIKSRHEIDDSGSIIVLNKFCPWKEHLFDIEKEWKIDTSDDSDNKILYCLYGDSGGSWRIQAVPEHPTSFESRKKLPDAWRGLRDEELSCKSGVDGCIFIHASGFIGGHSTKEGAIRLAKLALTMN